MNIRISNLELIRYDISTRMPFKYGIATMTHLPHVFLRIEASIDGRSQVGISADHLPPKWFTKNPDRDPSDEIEDMLGVIENTGKLAKEIEAKTVYNFWRNLYSRQGAWAKGIGIPSLLAHFGTSLVERALIDAFCSHSKLPFHYALANNSLGIDFSTIRPEIAGTQPNEWLPTKPLSQVMVRHTVGLADPIYDSEINNQSRIDDGLPESLEACIGFYGLKHFKIKICGDLDTDVVRTLGIAKLLEKQAPSDFAFTLDANEQFLDANQFRHYWNNLSDNLPVSFLDHLIFVEQPFHRDIALSDSIGEVLRNWKNAPPIIIDESDEDIDSLPEAISLGYKGTSHKNCKGVFKGIINRATINSLNRQKGVQEFLMSGEDLANIGPIANHQDLVLQAALGNESVERNGHHYFNGLSIFDQSIQDDTLESFPSMYTRDPDSVTRLDIRNGQLSVEELNELPFGISESIFNLIDS